MGLKWGRRRWDSLVENNYEEVASVTQVVWTGIETSLKPEALFS
jgi:hypothetical protein